MKEGSKSNVLVLFSFDHTLVDVDSTVHIAQTLDAELANAVWTKNAADDQLDRAKIMDEFFVQLAKERPQVTYEDIRNAARSLPFNQQMLDAIHLAVDDFGATCKIVSDATVFGIRSFLEHHGLTDRVSEVVANPTHFEDGGKVLRVRPYQGDHVAPHGCPNCPKNLCNGTVLEWILQQHQYSKVLYVGGDSCAASKLARGDEVFTHNGDTRLDDKIQAHVLETGDDFLASFRNFLHELKSSNHESNAMEIPRPISRRSEQLLVVFDFDESLVNKDSDTFAIQCFYPELLKTLQTRHAVKPVWPSVFDEMIQILVEERPEVTPELICEQVAQIPVQERMFDAARMAVEQFGADAKIISDGNSMYIESVLKHQGLAPYINTTVPSMRSWTMDAPRFAFIPITQIISNGLNARGVHPTCAKAAFWTSFVRPIHTLVSSTSAMVPVISALHRA